MPVFLRPSSPISLFNKPRDKIQHLFLREDEVGDSQAGIDRATGFALINQKMSEIN